MIVVSNTSPLTNLAAVGHLQLLPEIYGAIHIPLAVRRELENGEQRGDHPPFLGFASWLVVHTVPEEAFSPLVPFRLDVGEREALALTLHLKADLLLIDERIGREAANSLSIRTAGVLGTLLTAKRKGLVTAVQPVLQQLVHKAGFRVSDALLEHVLHLASEKP